MKVDAVETKNGHMLRVGTKLRSLDPRRAKQGAVVVAIDLPVVYIESIGERRARRMIPVDTIHWRYEPSEA